MVGYQGKVLNIDLEKGYAGEELLPESWYQDFIGGLGLGLQYLIEDLNLRKPLLKNPIIIMTGPLTGTPVPATSKAFVLSYQRVDEIFNLSSIEGRFPSYIKLAGFDGLIINGRSQEPVRVVIDGKGCVIREASIFYGKGISDLPKLSTDEKIDEATLSIGPAGENLNPAAGLVSDLWLNTGFGVGSDFGGKKLKQISVRAEHGLNIYKKANSIIDDVKIYLDRKYIELLPAQNRRGCFGCIKSCGWHPGSGGGFCDMVVLKELDRILPELTPDSRIDFNQECLNQGLHPLITALTLTTSMNEHNYKEIIGIFASKKYPPNKSKHIEHSWENAQLSIHQQYSDVEFGSLKNFLTLIKKENLVAIKNCLPICERWEMNIEEMIGFLKAVTGRKYEADSLMKIGGKIVSQLMGLYGLIGYKSMDFSENNRRSQQLPPVLEQNLKKYMHDRRWFQDGYPCDDELIQLNLRKKAD